MFVLLGLLTYWKSDVTVTKILHHGSKTAGIDIVWRNYVTATLWVCQYHCNWSVGKTRLWNDQLRVMRVAKLMQVIIHALQSVCGHGDHFLLSRGHTCDYDYYQNLYFYQTVPVKHYYAYESAKGTTSLQQWINCAPSENINIHRESKKGATLTMAITLSILDRFAKFFHCCKQQ